MNATATLTAAQASALRWIATYTDQGMAAAGDRTDQGKRFPNSGMQAKLAALGLVDFDGSRLATITDAGRAAIAPAAEVVEEVAPLAVVTLDGEELSVEVAATPAVRFYAARADGRYRVLDGNVIDARQDGDAPGAAYVGTYATRAKAEEKAAKLNASAADKRAAQDEFDAAQADLARTRRPSLAERSAAAIASEDAARDRAAARNVELIVSGQTSFLDAASAILSGRPVIATRSAAQAGAAVATAKEKAAAAKQAQMTAIAQAGEDAVAAVYARHAAAKAAAPAKGEAVRIYRLVPGQRVTLPGVEGVVEVTGNVKIDKRRNLVEFAGGSVELGADARARLAV